jgi:hypothetical protein
MKRHIVAAVAILAVLTTAGQAQFKSQAEQESRVSHGMIQDGSSSFLLGWFNPEKFHMLHSLSFSYQTLGGEGISLGTYTNSMMYEFAENLNARADVSLSYSPFASSGLMTKGMKDNLSSLYLSRAELNYKPWDNVLVHLQYRRTPCGMYYSPFGSPWFGEDGY